MFSTVKGPSVKQVQCVGVLTWKPRTFWPLWGFSWVCGHSQFQKYPQYCWEFHDRRWEARSGTNSEKRGVPSRTRGERILETLWTPQMPWIIGFGASQPYSRGKFQETLWERFRGLSGIFPEFLPESPSRTGGMAHNWNPFYAIKIPVDHLFLGIEIRRRNVQFCFKSLQKPLLILQCQNAENDPFFTQKVHGFLVQTPSCHTAPISRMYGGSVLLTGRSVLLRGLF